MYHVLQLIMCLMHACALKSSDTLDRGQAGVITNRGIHWQTGNEALYQTNVSYEINTNYVSR